MFFTEEYGGLDHKIVVHGCLERDFGPFLDIKTRDYLIFMTGLGSPPPPWHGLRYDTMMMKIRELMETKRVD